MPLAPLSPGLLPPASLVSWLEAPAQSALHPAGPAATEIARLWWMMLAAFTAVFVIVLALLLYAIYRGTPTSPATTGRETGTAPPWGRTGFIVAGGVILPILVLTPLFVYSLTAAGRLRTPANAVTIRVIGHMWWWEVRYPEQGIVTANEIHIPAGQPVRLELTSADVIHSFWVPRLNGKRDLIPGIENVFWIQADAPGRYRGQCGEYCGTQHANMAFEVIALPAEEYAAWLATRATPRTEPAAAEAQRGRQLFLTSGCVQCHAIQGTRAKANTGPDLTHIGSRQKIGAALLPNTRENLARWIADPQAIKPGIKMPRTELNVDDLQSLVTYLEGLK